MDTFCHHHIRNVQNMLHSNFKLGELYMQGTSDLYVDDEPMTDWDNFGFDGIFQSEQLRGKELIKEVCCSFAMAIAARLMVARLRRRT